MARHTAKRRQTPRPGLLAAAEALETNYSHLRRVVIGERKSRSLLKRYRQWKSDQRARKKLLKRAAREVDALSHAIHSANNSAKS